MPELKHLDWDLVRVLLAMLRSSSLRDAALALGVTHPTARRQLVELEKHLGFALFERHPEGLQPTARALQLRAPAEAMEKASLGFQRSALAADDELRGPIRVALPQILATDLLMNDLAAFTQRWPEVALQLEAASTVADLSRREADVAIRMVRRGTRPDEQLAGRLVATSFRAAYGRGDRWLGWYGGARDASWVKESPFPDLPVWGAMNHPALQRAACQAGLGLSQLPCFFAEPWLERASKPEPAYDIWVLVHEDLRSNPRLRAFRDAVADALRDQRPRLEGRRMPRQAQPRKARKSGG